MLLIEGGGQEQLPGELEAYNPLIPQGSDLGNIQKGIASILTITFLVGTLMFEIEDTKRREIQLYKLGHVEDTLFLSFENKQRKHKIIATPVNDSIHGHNPKKE